MKYKYKAGKKFEYEVRDFYKKQGYFIIMSAGSKGPIDVICYPIDNPTKPILNCQCKKYKDNKPNPTQEFRDLKIPGKKLWCTKKLRQVGFDIEEIL